MVNDCTVAQPGNGNAHMLSKELIPEGDRSMPFATLSPCIRPLAIRSLTASSRTYYGKFKSLYPLKIRGLLVNELEMKRSIDISPKEWTIPVLQVTATGDEFKPLLLRH